MLFNTPVFAVFFFAFYIVFWAIPALRGRLIWIILTSFGFYAYGYPSDAWILLAVTVVSLLFSRAVSDVTRDRAVRRRLLTVGIVLCLSVLVVYKYTGFIFENMEAALAAIGVDVSLPRPGLRLPVGISFFTFQAVGYMVDTYRGSFPGRPAAESYAASLTFFPHLVAGPVVRAAQLIPQLEKPPVITWDSAKGSVLLIVLGLAKKTAADLLSPVSQAFLLGEASGDPLSAWLGALSFAAQMYGDFSGYTDMAIGLAGLCGYVIPANFMLPYLATSPVEFWKRWHISLTTWMRDYVFFSLGTPRTDRALYRNLFITWLVTGIWHGARWTFIHWGLLHGVALAVAHYLDSRRRRLRKPKYDSALRSIGGWLVTMWIWITSLVVFGAPSAMDAARLLASMYVPMGGSEASSASLLLVAGVTLALVIPHGLDHFVVRKREIALKPWVIWPLVVVLSLFSLVFSKPGVDFIYFEF